MIRVQESLARDLLHVCRRLYERGLVAGSDGNVSLRLSKDALLATPTGQSKGFLTADDLVTCDLTGTPRSGKRRLTTEIKIHLAAYHLRDDVCAVVHAHPPYATAFAVAGETPSEKLMPEAYIAVGKVALAPYGTPSTDELSESLRPFVREHDAILLANHGAMTFGRDVIAAFNRMEALEQLCRITFITRVLGNARTLDAGEMAKLDAIRGIYGAAADNVPCYQCGWKPEAGTVVPRRAEAESPGSGGAASPRGARPQAFREPAVHWPGNPPVWERPGAPPTLEEAQVRDLVRREIARRRGG
jgi:L-fuculose-phosphate aldolase